MIELQRCKKLFIDFDGVIVDSNKFKELAIKKSVYELMGKNKISIEAVIQDEESKKADKVPILIFTEKIKEHQADAARLAISEMSGILGPVKQFRVQKDN